MYTKIIKPTMKEIKEKTESSKIIGSKKICRFCSAEFTYGSKSRTSCGLCKIDYFCEYCNKEIISKIA